MTQATVIEDSISPAGVRLTTIEVTLHRFVLAELNTHRCFSRNSASSRAIPFHKQVERVLNDPAIPVVWPAEQKGMQGGDQVANTETARDIWLEARDDAVTNAKFLHEQGVHKSVVNRLLEPFMWHTVIVSATEWDGFWKQRCSPLAQPEIRVAAEAMRYAYDNSEPQPVGMNGWHLPYVSHAERSNDTLDVLKRVSVARCARVSYLTHDGKRDTEKDLELYFRLVEADPAHASPLEHVATPTEGYVAGNFRGWRQMRHEELGF